MRLRLLFPRVEAVAQVCAKCYAASADNHGMKGSHAGSTLSMLNPA